MDERAKRIKIVIEEYNGVLPYTEVFYIESLKYSADRCIQAFTLYEQYKKNGSDADLIASLIQEALSHAAALSRYFVPGTKNELSLARGNKFREAFNVTGEILLMSKYPRNAMEHFDERLDQFLLNDLAGTIHPQARLGDHSEADSNIDYIFKLVDTENSIFIILGEKYHFGAVRQEVTRILEVANEMLNNNGRLKKL